MFDRSQIMRRAHRIMRETYSASDIRACWSVCMSRSLKDAWNEARYLARINAMSSDQRRVETEIAVLEAHDHWTPAEYARREALSHAIA